MKLAVAMLLMASAPAQAGGPWANLAKADLSDIRSLLAENHPGPVDPQNPAYARRLQENYVIAVARAEQAKSFFDYKRAVLLYLNSFRDGHTAVIWSVEPASFQWPGFEVQGEGKTYRITAAEADLPVKTGDEILSCDGSSIDQLLRDRTDPFYWNADIPHERASHVGKIFAIEAGDSAANLTSCTFRDAGTVQLSWRTLPRDRAQQLRGLHVYEGDPSLTHIGDMWIVKLPSFMIETPLQVERMRKLLADMTAHLDEMRRGKVVLDVRGNGGGSSGWAEEVSKLLWGQDAVDRIKQSFDWTVDWRASAANIQKLDDTAARYERNGNAQRAAGFRSLRDQLAKARAEGQPLAHVDASPSAPNGPAKPSPFTGRAYLLTDGVCASACLDFTDAVRRLPGATQVGWPTSADAVYIDNTLVTLPSGLARFGYSMKVYRHRVRGNNQWYDPQIPWPGGRATDAAVMAWLSSLRR